MDVSELVYWRTGKESRKRQFESLGAERDVLDSLFPPTFNSVTYLVEDLVVTKISKFRGARKIA